MVENLFIELYAMCGVPSAECGVRVSVWVYLCI